MAEHSLYGKKRLCYTEVSDYTDYQGIGRDPLYKRFDSVNSVIKNLVDEKYQEFLAQPMYSASEDQIDWYIKSWNETPTRYLQLLEVDKAAYRIIKEETLKHYNERLMIASGEDLHILTCALKYIDDESLYCYDGKVVVVAWGMTPDTKQHKITGAIIHELSFEKKYKVTFDCGTNGSLSSVLERTIQRSDGFELTAQDLPLVTPNERYTFDGWGPISPIGHKVVDNVLFTARYSKTPAQPPVEPIPAPHNPEYVNVSFISEVNGAISGNCYLTIEKGHILTASQIPKVDHEAGRDFVGWTPSVDAPITTDTVFLAQFTNNTFTCHFDEGEHGCIEGLSSLSKAVGTSILHNEIPSIKPHKGYTFVGWDIAPLNTCVTKDRVFTAQYEHNIPWYSALWAWFTGKGCLKWILWMLLVLLLLFLFLFLLRSCHSEDDVNKVHPIERVETPDGSVIDDNINRDRIGIIEEDGTLPGGHSSIVAPIVGQDGALPPIVKNPGVPDIIANRLNIYFEDEGVDLNAFAQHFKKVYVGEEYQIIGFDDKVKMIQIQIPENERDKIRETINAQLPDYKFFIIDESVFQGTGDAKGAGSDAGWHLKAIRAFEAWNITKGADDVVVAVVDDGLDHSHSMFAGRIVKPYNVFTQSNRLSVGDGHGTHVAGLAVGSSEYVISRGVSGIAPGCKLMPIQVFDNKLCTFSSTTSGIMYAIHEGAAVVNISIGPTFEGLSALPIDAQKEIARTHFKNEEKVWRKIIQIANKKNCILVFAAGNDKLLASIPPENRTNASVNVAAIDKTFSVASFSNYGEGANASAPGVDIYSSFPKNNFQYAKGTSMAAPIVAGTIALMKSINKDITVKQVLQVLQHTGKPISGNVPPMVQADKALQAVKSGNYSGAIPNPVKDEEIASDGGNDYVEIRNLIEKYKEKIVELEQQLPENKNKNR